MKWMRARWPGTCRPNRVFDAVAEVTAQTGPAAGPGEAASWAAMRSASLASAGCPGCREMTPTCRSGRAHAGGQGRLPGAEHLRGRAVPLEAIMQLVIRDAAALAYGDPPS